MVNSAQTASQTHMHAGQNDVYGHNATATGLQATAMGNKNNYMDPNMGNQHVLGGAWGGQNHIHGYSGQGMYMQGTQAGVPLVTGQPYGKKNCVCSCS